MGVLKHMPPGSYFVSSIETVLDKILFDFLSKYLNQFRIKIIYKDLI